MMNVVKVGLAHLEGSNMSLESDLQDLENQILIEETAFYKTKMLMLPELNKRHAFLLLKAEFDKHINRVFHEYDIDYCLFGDRQILKCQLSPLQLKYVQALTKFICNDSNLKPLATLVGKSAEMAFRNSINSLFNLFSIKKKIEVNSKNFVYGGDGGGDFFIGNRIFDVKYRNDSPAHGMILEKPFLERTLDDVILIHVTNSAAIKIGTNDSVDKTLPLALSGWMSVKEFKKVGKPIANGRDSLAVDNLHPIVDLLMLVLEDQIDSESLFFQP